MFLRSMVTIKRIGPITFCRFTSNFPLMYSQNNDGLSTGQSKKELTSRLRSCTIRTVHNCPRSHFLVWYVSLTTMYCITMHAMQTIADQQTDLWTELFLVTVIESDSWWDSESKKATRKCILWHSRGGGEERSTGSGHVDTRIAKKEGSG